jgi:hypothetical protein
MAGGNNQDKKSIIPVSAELADYSILPKIFRSQSKNVLKISAVWNKR